MLMQFLSFFPMQPTEKRPPEAPSSTKVLPASTPSGPRAMTETSRAKAEPINSRDRHRDIPSSQTKASAAGAGSSHPEGPITNLGSLRSRIGEKEIPLPSSYRGESSRNDDDRESSRKRTASGKSILFSSTYPELT